MAASGSDAPPSYTQLAGEDKAPLLPTAQPAPAGASYGTSPTAQPVIVVYQQAPPSGMTFGGMDPQLEHQRLQSTTVKWLRYIPAMHICPAITFFIFNTIIPGLGTWLACCCMCCCMNTVVKSDSKGKILCLTFWFGMLQLLTCPIVIGYILAMLWSYGTIFNYRLYFRRPIEKSEIQTPQAAPYR